ncbi:MAG TPA: histidine ammonia-lyase [Bryobacteraceae bacterium]|jgi:histidine ammonia-lyase|nr:histidine ammonia-lyase [Bryobacteraceae bacterium]
MILLDGETLTLAQVGEIARGNSPVGIAPAAIQAMRRSRAVVEKLAAGDDPVYAVNTGVGLLADVRIPFDDLATLQRNVVRSHAAGIGEPLSRAETRAMMLVRANVLARGYSGIRPAVAELLCDLLNRRVTPVVPARGSVGASGDLAPLAHMALVMIGEGEAEYEGAIMPGGEALRRAKLEPLTLESKEGISLLNGTQAMLAIGCLELEQAERLARAADVVCAMTLDGLKGTPRAFDPRIHHIRPHLGQRASAANLSRLLEGSEIRQSHITCRKVQDAYSLRCAPQVHGAVRDALAEARRIFEIEINSVTDNPLVIGEEIISGGNFHGQPLAFALDYLAIALTALAGISERRIDRLVNPALNEDLPPFLAAHAGLESGFMMVQVSAAALVAENRVLANPASPGSITTSGNKEDFVSMGMTAAIKLRQVVANTRSVLAMEALAAARALDFLAPLKSGAPVEEARRRLREVCPAWEGDQVFSHRIRAVDDWLSTGGLERL